MGNERYLHLRCLHFLADREVAAADSFVVAVVVDLIVVAVIVEIVAMVTIACCYLDFLSITYLAI